MARKAAPPPPMERAEVRRVLVEEFGRRGQPFRFQELRERLGIENPKSREGIRLWNQFDALRQQGLVEPVTVTAGGEARKRHRAYLVVDRRGGEAPRTPPDAPRALELGQRLRLADLPPRKLAKVLDALDRLIEAVDEVEAAIRE